WELERDELDAFSLESHSKAAKAMDNDALRQEILPIELDSGTFDQDEGVRRDTSLEKLADLTPSFQPDDGAMTDNYTRQISDGAASVLSMSHKNAKDLQVKPRAKISARTVVGADPVMILPGVIPATKKVLQQAGLPMEEIDAFEIN